MTFFDSIIEASVPSSLHGLALDNSSKLRAALTKRELANLENTLRQDEVLAERLIRCLVGSEYLLESCCRTPHLLSDWLLKEVAHSPLSATRINELATTMIGNSESLDSLDSNLRYFRCQIMLAIIWRDLSRLSSLEETTAMMTSLAELCLEQAASFHFDHLVEEVGRPIGDKTNVIQPFLIIGMGKLGGGELNVSSDIDLIFAFPEDGHTDHQTKSIDNQSFFTRLGQRLIKTLHTMTVEGFVFRVDMRLRPYGNSGALVCNLASLEEYYQSQGRDWERFAMIKARLVNAILPSETAAQTLEANAIIQSAREQLETILRSFTYRRYVDFSVIESLRRLKLSINQEIRRKGILDDIKLGPGGIREIEFIVQTFQLIHGGRAHQLQRQPLLPVLKQLGALRCLDCEVTQQLAEAYVFLRNTEHALQAYRDEQTQRLPHHELDRERLSWMMSFDDWDAFNKEYEYHCHIVDQHFQRMVADRLKEEAVFPEQTKWTALWQQTLTDQDSFLQQQGFSQPQDVLKWLQQLRSKPDVLQMSSTARERLDALMPLLLSTVANVVNESPDEILVLTLELLEKIIRRTSYMVLLLENPNALARLIQLCSASSWIAEQLIQLPSLLDELINVHDLYSLPDKAYLRDELRQQLMRINVDDLEATMEALRYFRIVHSLRAAASEVMGHLPLMKASDYLTFLAEVILEQVLLLTWQSLYNQYGGPDGDRFPNFIIVGYGKLGGLELSYDSDLDLVFIYQADPTGMTSGEKSIDNHTFYTRMGQKITHILNTRTLSGQLYEVDMRLRPSGNSGLLVTSIQSFEHYQSENAWIWEHQALVRARVVAGDQPLGKRFDRVRQHILCQQRDLTVLQKSVVDMRKKMRAHLGISNLRNKSELFHLKQDSGGVVDIEFMVQYAVLAWSSKDPSLVEYTDNVRILGRLHELGLLRADQAKTLTETYKLFRAIGHRFALQQKKSPIVDAKSYIKQRHQVQTIWQSLLGSVDDSLPPE